MGDVIVLHATCAGQGLAAPERLLLERLPYAHRLELERRPAAARTASLRGLCLLAEGFRRLRQAAFDPSRLHFPQGGKPLLKGGPQFSVSHSARRVAVAVSECHELGLDLEDVGTHARTCAELERWTAVEASLKVLGNGLRRAPQVRLAPDLATAECAGILVHLRRVDLAPGCVATLATREPVGAVLVEAAEGRGYGIGDRG